ncbi:DNA-binding protein [Streptomyces sp. TLI_105]|uniref:telomere-protecting terminal protein Tpg n=1 Tax=Streptomyces sp. TLI_105 TaxID=1881019 RepID=UPI000B88CE3E|nr:DNA-binding protein [Streptomyces sp. TLI_105]
MKSVGEGLDRVLDKALTRPVPKTAGAQVRFLVKQLKGTRAVAGLLGISQRTVERYVKGQIKKPRPQLAALIQGEASKRWQPKVKEKAKKAAASTNGLMIDVRASLGYEAPAGTTDEARERHLTLALPPRHAERIFAAQERGGEQQMRQAVADALKEVYFQQRGTRAASLEEVRMLNVEHIEFDL